MKRISALCLCLLMTLGVLPQMTTAAATTTQTTDKPIYVLAIGHSYSSNAITYFLHDMAMAGGVDLRVGNLYRAGERLRNHWAYAQSGEKVYAFETFYDTSEGRKSTPNYSIEMALKSQDWDYVTFQQDPINSGKIDGPDGVEPYLTYLSAYVRNMVPNAKQYYHQTWAYEKGFGDNTPAQASQKWWWEDYGYDQETMLNAIKAVAEHAKSEHNMKTIPCGEAMWIAQTTTPFDINNNGKTLYAADGYHANPTYGYFLLSAVWYEVITGKSILDNPYTVDGISDDELTALRQSAHDAVAQHYTDKITDISIKSKPAKLTYQQGESLDTTGCVVGLTFSDSEPEDRALINAVTSGYDAEKLGEQTVTVTLYGKSATFQVNVVAKGTDSGSISGSGSGQDNGTGAENAIPATGDSKSALPLFAFFGSMLVLLRKKWGKAI